VADTLTANYGWVMPQDQGSPDTWGQKLNADLAAIDAQVFANANLPTPNNVSTISSASADATFSFFSYQGAVGQQGRWQWSMDITPESGGNAGSNLNLVAYSDTGVALSPVPLTISRTGNIGVNGALAINQGIIDFVNVSGNVSGQIGLYPNGLEFFQAPGFPVFTPSGGILGRANTGPLMILNQNGPIFFGPMTLGPFLSSANTTQINFTNTPLTANSANGHLVWGIQTTPQPDNLYMEMSVDAFIGAAASIIISNNNFTFNGTGIAYKAGGGSWTALSSDARIKTVDGDYQTGLAAVLALHPVHYTYLGNDGDGLTGSFIGLVAQEAEEVMPEMVAQRHGTIDGRQVEDLRTLDTSSLIFALVNAVKELKAEIDELKAAR
jgi:hypothetical protein